MSVHSGLPISPVYNASLISSSSSWFTSSPIIYGGYTYSPYSFDFVRDWFSSLSKNFSLPFLRSFFAEISTWEDDFWWLNVLWFIFPIVCPLLVHLLEISIDKNARHWWRSQRSFQPPFWLNCICVFQFIASNNAGLFVARYFLGRPLHSIHNFTFLGDACQWLILAPLTDLLTMLTHWFQHIYPTVYKYSHSTHHKVKFSTMWIVYYANPIDFLITTLWIYTFLCTLFDFHFYQMILLNILNVTNLTLTHSNYREITNGHHQIHHLEPRYNFCPGNPLIDRLFGTLMTVEEYSKIRDPEKIDGGDKDN